MIHALYDRWVQANLPSGPFPAKNRNTVFAATRNSCCADVSGVSLAMAAAPVPMRIRVNNLSLSEFTMCMSFSAVNSTKSMRSGDFLKFAKKDDAVFNLSDSTTSSCANQATSILKASVVSALVQQRNTVRGASANVQHDLRPSDCGSCVPKDLSRTFVGCFRGPLAAFITLLSFVERNCAEYLTTFHVAVASATDRAPVHSGTFEDSDGAHSDGALSPDGAYVLSSPAVLCIRALCVGLGWRLRKGVRGFHGGAAQRSQMKPTPGQASVAKA